MYEFSSKSQPQLPESVSGLCCLRYCKCTSFQANHNLSSNAASLQRLFAILQMYEFSSKSQPLPLIKLRLRVVCDTANVRVFKQITTYEVTEQDGNALFAILQMYEFSSKSQLRHKTAERTAVVCDTANVRVFKQITTIWWLRLLIISCLRYCKCTSFQANHNP